jgi:hypothetical protein
MIEYQIFRGNVIRIRLHKNFKKSTRIKKNKILHNRNFIGIGFNR